ncbi:NF-kappa-B inhibitor epsilon [Anguilla rostrata]|uniref:NF-kappa-B inhibitor epsilon n=1 Tax=Anguilla rostrata TaxID=7938 RepID=UPI0030D408E5
MANSDYEKRKVDLSEDGQIDSGIDSFRSLNKDYQCIKPTQGSNADDNEGNNDKLDSVSGDRLDSAYGSSSLTVDSLNEIIQSCSISEQPESENPESCSEQEVNLLTTVTEDGDTILHLAIIHEEEDFAHQLIELFPKDILDIQNNLYQTPLHLATYLNSPSVVRRLLEQEASLELQDQEGNTPLHLACDQGRNDCASEMGTHTPPRQLSVVMEMQNWRGQTCLHLATQRRNHRMVKLLLKKGAKLNTQDGTSGKTALHMAVELQDVQLVKLLLNKGANVDAAMFNGCTPLHLAVGRQDAGTTLLLCQSGADQMLKNMEDETALDLADGNDSILAIFPFDDIQISGRSVMEMKF